MKRIYFASSFKFREEVRSLFIELRKYFKQKNVDLYSFVFEYSGDIEDHKLMNNDIDELNRCDLIILEPSRKSIGVGIEAGYMRAQNKKVIYLHRKDLELEPTINGISDFVIVYENSSDVINWFDKNEKLIY